MLQRHCNVLARERVIAKVMSHMNTNECNATYEYVMSHMNMNACISRSVIRVIRRNPAYSFICKSHSIYERVMSHMHTNECISHGAYSFSSECEAVYIHVGVKLQKGGFSWFICKSCATYECISRGVRTRRRPEYAFIYVYMRLRGVQCMHLYTSVRRILCTEYYECIHP